MIFPEADHTFIAAQLVLLMFTAAGLGLAMPSFRARRRREQEQIQLQHWQAWQQGMVDLDPEQPIWGLPPQPPSAPLSQR